MKIIEYEQIQNFLNNGIVSLEVKSTKDGISFVDVMCTDWETTASYST